MKSINKCVTRPHRNQERGDEMGSLRQQLKYCHIFTSTIPNGLYLCLKSSTFGRSYLGSIAIQGERSSTEGEIDKIPSTFKFTEKLKHKRFVVNAVKIMMHLKSKQHA
uniref:Uncharacterized protein n=1 Tax=Romanomermis culicivorax TaxID=13658 RepID=A0A915JZ44_ROMCU